MATWRLKGLTVGVEAERLHWEIAQGRFEVNTIAACC